MYMRTRILSRKAKKEITIIIFIFSWLFLGIGYAYLNNNLAVDGVANLTNATWDIYLDNIVPKENNVETISPPTIKNKTSLEMNVTLENPGDVYSFDVDIVNAGSIDAVLHEMTKSQLSEKQQEYLEYTVKHLNNKDLTVNDKLSNNSRDTINITIKYKEVEAITEDEQLDLKLDLNYIQDNNK